jgi:mannose-6-phosphate isomerase-like protein (cupin superfamily)
MVYFQNMTNLASSSGEFRKVLHTGLYSQLVLMTIPVGGDIGDEVHTVDQILTFTSGQAKATVNGKDQDVKAGDLVIVPAGTQHQFVNTGKTPLVSCSSLTSSQNPQVLHATNSQLFNHPRSSTQSTPQPSIIRKQYITQKKKATRKRRKEKMKRQSGVGDRSRRMRMRDL